MFASAEDEKRGNLMLLFHQTTNHHLKLVTPTPTLIIY